MVCTTAAKWWRPYLDREDLKQAYRLAAFEAISTYDPARGPYSAHVAILMRAACRDHAISNSPMAAPKSKRELRLMCHLPGVLSELEGLGRSPSIAVAIAADAFGVTPEHARDAIELKQGGKVVGEGFGDDVWEPAAEEMDPVAGLQHEQVRAVIDLVMSTLDDEDRALLELRLEGWSFDALADLLGTSRERIRRRLSVLLEDVRAEFDVRGLTLDDLLTPGVSV
nr:hypothetical protein DWF04_16570 [Cereibacter sphaeroides f. sp. denitrificans]